MSITTVEKVNGYDVLPGTNLVYDKKYDIVYASLIDGELAPLSKQDIQLLNMKWCEFTYNNTIFGEKYMKKRQESIKRLKAELRFETEYFEHFAKILGNK